MFFSKPVARDVHALKTSQDHNTKLIKVIWFPIIHSDIPPPYDDLEMLLLLADFSLIIL
jgi:hypothetical protein